MSDWNWGVRWFAKILGQIWPVLISWNFLWTTLFQLSSGRFNSFLDYLVSQMPQRLVQYVLTWRGSADIIDLVMNNWRSQKYWRAMWVYITRSCHLQLSTQVCHICNEPGRHDALPNLDRFQGVFFYLDSIINDEELYTLDSIQFFIIYFLKRVAPHQLITLFIFI